MIPGDIDLTEHLDFRNVTRKQLPQLPGTWNGGDSLNTKQNTFNIISSYNASFTTNTTVRYDISDINLWFNDGFDENYITISDDYLAYDEPLTLTTTYSNITSTTYSMRNNTWLTWNYSNRKTLKTSISYNNSEPEYDIFGNVKKPKEKEYIPDIPWDTSTINLNNDKRIPWKTNRDTITWGDYEKDKIPRIAWDYRPFKRKSDVYEFGIDMFDRAKHFISWFESKSESFIKRHLSFYDEDNSSFLTNMNWIRVRDAVIDIV